LNNNKKGELEFALNEIYPAKQVSDLKSLNGN